MRSFFTIVFFLNCIVSQAQFTYFNQITGVLDDENSELLTNVEVVNDGYVCWSAGVDSTLQLYLFTRKYDFDGGILVEKSLIFPNQYTYCGVINSFKWNPYNQRFVYIQGYALPGGIVEAFLIEFDQNLDTTFTKRYALYPPYTYAIAFEVESDGYIVLGELGGTAANGAGTFIMKLSFSGDVLWKEILKPNIPTFIYRNMYVLAISTGYLISGKKSIITGNHSTTVRSGLHTLTDDMGHSVAELEVQYEDALMTGMAVSVKTTNGEIWFCRGVAYANVEEIDSPYAYWSKIRVEKFDLQTTEIYEIQDYHEDYEFIMGGPNKMIATPDGGVVILGARYGFYFDMYSWMMKLDAEGNEEWFQEYTYQSCENCSNILYDIEIAPDGGYIAAGTFADYAYDRPETSWLLKVDACGDVEWQGCSPVGVTEKREIKTFSVYPNPSTGKFTIASDFNHTIASWSVYNLSGQKVVQGKTLNSENLEMNLNLPAGLYTLELVQKDGRRENHKIQILR